MAARESLKPHVCPKILQILTIFNIAEGWLLGELERFEIT